MKGEIELEDIIFIFKGHKTPAKGNIPKQLVEPTKINYNSRMIQAHLKCEKGRGLDRDVLCSFGFDRYMVCDKNSPAAILFGKSHRSEDD